MNQTLMEMKTFKNGPLTVALYHVGLWGIDKPEFLEKKKFENEKDIKAHLKDLQKEYGGRSRVEFVYVPLKNRTRYAYQVSSDVDWGYLAIVCGPKGIKK